MVVIVGYNSETIRVRTAQKFHSRISTSYDSVKEIVRYMDPFIAFTAVTAAIKH
jgi:hypothetical protein